MMNSGLVLKIVALVMTIGQATASDLRDPTRPLIDTRNISSTTKPTSAQKPNTPLVVKAIYKSKEGFKAYVNDRLVRVGETVRGYRVMTISETSVTLASGNKRLQLTLATKVKAAVN